MGRTYDLVDLTTTSVADVCTGPDANGACPRVRIGETVACSGRALRLHGVAGAGYAVGSAMTLCPVTLAASLAVPVETDLIEQGPTSQLL